MAIYNSYQSPDHSYTPNPPSTSSDQSYAPSAPPMQQQQQQQQQQYQQYQHQYSSSSSSPSPNYSGSSYSGYSPPYPQQGGAGYYYYSGHVAPQQYYPSFPPGTSPEVIRSFMAVDRDRSGSIDERELQSALSSVYRGGFGIRTVRLLLFLFKNPRGPSDRIGPAEFAVLWDCLGQWRIVFDRFDKDRSGMIDSEEFKEALRSLGYAVPLSVIQIIMSNYSDSLSGRFALNFDNFVECGMIVKGITDKFKEKDASYSGSATFTYESFLTTVIPFIVP